MVYHPNYNETKWRALRDKTGPTRDVLKRISGLGLTLPPYPYNSSKETSSYYQTNGLCNYRCRRTGDHATYPKDTKESRNGPSRSYWGGGGGRRWRQMTPPPGDHPWTHTGQHRGQHPQYKRCGRDTKSPAHQIIRGDSSGARQKVRERRLTRCQYSKALATCATPDNPNNVPDPNPPGKITGRTYYRPS